MNKRIRNKIYKRSIKKLDDWGALYDGRTYLQIAKEENILSGLEKKVFIKEQNKIIKFTNEILKEIMLEEQLTFMF